MISVAVVAVAAEVAVVAVAAKVSEILESIFRLSILEFRAFAPKVAMVVFFQSCPFVVKALSEWRDEALPVQGRSSMRFILMRENENTARSQLV